MPRKRACLRPGVLAGLWATPAPFGKDEDAPPRSGRSGARDLCTDGVRLRHTTPITAPPVPEVTPP